MEKSVPPLFTQHLSSPLSPLLSSCLHLTLAPLWFPFLFRCLSPCLSLRPCQGTLNKRSLSSSPSHLLFFPLSLSLICAHTPITFRQQALGCVGTRILHYICVCVCGHTLPVCVMEDLLVVATGQAGVQPQKSLLSVFVSPFEGTVKEIEEASL